jgi:glycosyltransferase involved in cell wall biosynthesis
MSGAGKVYDVCLLLEGTYPFVSGGVSSWLHNLISGIPDISFTAICILPSSQTKWEHKYRVPPNFQDLQVIYLHDPVPITPERLKRVKREQLKPVKEFHQRLQKQDVSLMERIVASFRNNEFPLYDLVHGKEVWKYLVNEYQPEINQDSFIDYFWTIRITHLPIFKMLSVELPKARVYHSISTGYAGLLGAMAQMTNKRPLLLTEHGIYFKERKIEISQAEWIFDAENRPTRVERKLNTFQDIWIQIFRGLSLLTYRSCERIFTLYEGNRALEIADGAPPERIEIIPNGINLEVYQKLAEQRRFSPDQAVYAIGFVGRVVPIKDVKTFIRACKIVSMRLKNLKVYVMGPTEEDEDYFEECKKLVALLELQNIFEFTGKVRVLDYYPKLDVMVLTSVSEGQPLVILEANCAGLPAVASDVGSCRELLEGRTPEDQALGPSGLVTRAADPMDTAKAILTILTDHELRQRMSVSGLKRVAAFYRESDLNAKYSSIYKHYMEQPDKAGV